MMITELGLENIIGNYAFPIVACAALSAYIWIDRKSMWKIAGNAITQAVDIANKFTDALNKNSEVIAKLSLDIEKMVDGGNGGESNER